MHFRFHRIDYIKQPKGNVTARPLLASYELSERRLEHRFHATVGVSPRHYIKVARFQVAVHLIKAGHCGKLSDIAYELGYTDQSHFIKHVKDMSGLSPKSFQKQLLDKPVNQLY